jgi:glycosyltransferase involved in cell wall biosynthesis
MELNVRHRLHLPGFLADVRPAYAAMDAAVMLARYQSFCLMLAEAMLARKPIIGLQGAGEYTETQYPLITSENAILFPREKPWDAFHPEQAISYHKVANALVSITSDSALSTSMTETAYDWVASRFTATLQAQRCYNLYRKLVP